MVEPGVVRCDVIGQTGLSATSLGERHVDRASGQSALSAVSSSLSRGDLCKTPFPLMEEGRDGGE